MQDETVLHHRSPILDDELGLASRTFALDTLHTFFLGPVLRFCILAVWHCIENRYFGPFDPSEAELPNICNVMRTEAKHFYAEYHSQHPEDNSCPVWNTYVPKALVRKLNHALS